MALCPKCNQPMNPFCSSLSAEARCLLCKYGVKTAYPRKKTLYQFFCHKNVFILQSGFGVFCYGNENGEQVSLSFAKPGDLFGLTQLLSSYQTDINDMFLQTLMPTTGCLIPLKEIECMCGERLDFMAAIRDAALQAQINMASLLMKLAGMSSEEKVRYLFGVLKENEISLNEITHSDIALLLNLNRFTVTKCIKIILSGK